MPSKKKILQGEFETPKVWVDKCHHYIDHFLGNNWKEKNLVWDSAAGTGNLTKECNFSDLILSTINKEDVDFLLEKDINPGSYKFQFDFLNDNLQDLPEEVKSKLEKNNDLFFIINPPYGKGKARKDNTSGIGKTNTNLQMLGDGIGRASSQLYCQFLYRINQIKENYNLNIKIALFSAPLFMTANSNKKFRNFFYERFNFKGGFLVNSKTFNNREEWGISMTLWEDGPNQSDDIILDIFQLNDNYHPYFLKKKLFYHVNNQNSGDIWVKKEAKKKKNIDYPKVKNPISVINDEKQGKACDGFLGFLHIHGNEVLYNESLVGLYSASYFFTIAGIQIIPENFEKCCSFFMSRKAIDRNWINEKDEYLKPDENHSDYQQWVNNSLVYICFNNSSNQSSLRNVFYHGQYWDIPNNFFWLPKSEVIKMAEKYDYPEILNDAYSSQEEERYLYKILKERDIDPHFNKILEMVNELFYKSFSKRREFSHKNPQYHLDSWDAGYAQLKPFWKQEFIEDFRKIKKAYRELSISLKDQVYDLGFLRKI